MSDNRDIRTILESWGVFGDNVAVDLEEYVAEIEDEVEARTIHDLTGRIGLKFFFTERES